MLVHVLQEHPQSARAQRLSVVLRVPAVPEPQVVRQQRCCVIGGDSGCLRVAKKYRTRRQQLFARAAVVS